MPIPHFATKTEFENTLYTTNIHPPLMQQMSTTPPQCIVISSLCKIMRNKSNSINSDPQY